MLLENALEEGIGNIFSETFGAFFEILIDVVLLPVISVIWLANIIITIFWIILAIVLLGLLIYALVRYTKTTLKEFFMLIGLALFQSLLFALYIFLLERLIGVWLTVSSKGTVFTYGEIVIIFMIFIIVGDILGELIRNVALKHRFKPKWVALLVAPIQLALLYGCLVFMNLSEILTIHVILNGASIGVFWELLYLFIPILAAELIVEYVRHLEF